MRKQSKQLISRSRQWDHFISRFLLALPLSFVIACSQDDSSSQSAQNQVQTPSTSKSDVVIEEGTIISALVEGETDEETLLGLDIAQEDQADQQIDQQGHCSIENIRQRAQARVQRLIDSEEAEAPEGEEVAQEEQAAEGQGQGRGQGRGRGRGLGHLLGQKARLLFIYDVDHSNDFSETEIATIEEDLVARCEAKRENHINRFDANDDGRLDDSEREVARETRHQEREENRRQFVEQYDDDRDGEIDDDERSEAIEEDRVARRDDDENDREEGRVRDRHSSEEDSSEDSQSSEEDSSEDSQSSEDSPSSEDSQSSEGSSEGQDEGSSEGQDEGSSEGQDEGSSENATDPQPSEDQPSEDQSSEDQPSADQVPAQEEPVARFPKLKEIYDTNQDGSLDEAEESALRAYLRERVRSGLKILGPEDHEDQSNRG